MVAALLLISMGADFMPVHPIEAINNEFVSFLSFLL
jgi:hypothetical protein